MGGRGNLDFEFMIWMKVGRNLVSDCKIWMRVGSVEEEKRLVGSLSL
jgi:hypothetical protein